MKIQVTFKDPDGVSDAISDAIPTRKARDDCVWWEDRDAVMDDLSRWIRGCEYVTIEFDTEAGTATVMETKR